MKKIKKVIIHCSATSNGKHYDAEDIHKWHLNRGWSGIGYHKVIGITGNIENGRPDYWIGAHAVGYNKDSVGICLIGTDKFTKMQYDSLAALLFQYKQKYGSDIEILGHRDLSPDKNRDGKITKNEWIKICPGFDVSEFLKERGL